VLINEGVLDLVWYQRSVDTVLGLPFNIASYATLLHLLAKEAKCKEGKLIGMLADVHIYDNHIEGVRKMIMRDNKRLPVISTPNFSSIFQWEHSDTKVIGYDPHPSIEFDIAV
jgi:thymidylate synthase